MIYLVSYDLNGKKDYASLIAEIKKSSDWAHLLLSAWGVETNEGPQALYNRLAAHIDGDDNLMVTQLVRGFGWWAKLSNERLEWMKRATEKA